MREKDFPIHTELNEGRGKGGPGHALKDAVTLIKTPAPLSGKSGQVVKCCPAGVS